LVFRAAEEKQLEMNRLQEIEQDATNRNCDSDAGDAAKTMRLLRRSAAKIQVLERSRFEK